jgi:mRNA interferase YafQ
MYTVALAARAKKSLQKYSRSGSFPQEKFIQALFSLRKNGFPPSSFRDHALKGELLMYREFHLASNILVLYERDDSLHIITISKIGTHSELFGE